MTIVTVEDLITIHLRCALKALERALAADSDESRDANIDTAVFHQEMAMILMDVRRLPGG